MKAGSTMTGDRCSPPTVSTGIPSDATTLPPPTLADLLHPSHRDAAPPASLAFGSPPPAPSLCDPLAIFDTVAASRSLGSPSHHRP
ncbi:Os06g0572000 [Oryza sativa Japonica Group]|uniref:Os06g0572000 protein n=2 Tax=Oryza sativa subsp. japonica TaxID=39947 RepID=Q0DBE1_ORYSJ|nr:Os06g0572000 [Oryza sativa Japonica Group]BAS98323.1 Os06g0572000 [Oryza sativa Japonica Group]|eukprot:NP_001057918.1 Os06g0572000 [Oryza sativa Japonica Group]